MPSKIIAVTPHSPASRTRLRAGDTLLSVNGHPVRDVLDWRFYSYETRLTLEVTTPGGKQRTVHLRKGEGEDAGLEFESYLMDVPRHCANKCIFCFVDQLPKGMRETLYFKDDDSRMSFLMGNYITLTNLSEEELERMMELRISPINVSVHATDPELRVQMLKNPRAAEGYAIMQRLAGAGIEMNCQIVSCPGINDGDALGRTMADLRALWPHVPSVSVVPVGLTMHREGLCELRGYDRESAIATIDQVEKYAEECLATCGSRIFFCSDELYIKAGRPLPEEEYYEGYPQLENGVGMLRSLITEFEDALGETENAEAGSFTIATGVAAEPFLRELTEKAHEKFPQITGEVIAIMNDRFGHTIDVAGLVTGGDLIAQLRGRKLGDRLLIPVNMLRHGEGVFLDDVTVEDVERELGVPVTAVDQDGGALLRAMLDKEEKR